MKQIIVFSREEVSNIIFDYIRNNRSKFTTSRKGLNLTMFAIINDKNFKRIEIEIEEKE